MRKLLFATLLAGVAIPVATFAQTTPAPDAATTPPAETTAPADPAMKPAGSDAAAPADPAKPADAAAPADAGSTTTDTTTTVPMQSGTTDAAAPADSTKMPDSTSADTKPADATAPADSTSAETKPADATAPSATSTETPAAGTMATTETKSSGAAIEGPFVTVPPTGAWRASDLEGKDVYDAAGEDIGEISDVLVSEDGEVIAVLVGVGGFLGIGEKDVAVSMEALEFGPTKTEGLPKAAEVAAAPPPPPPAGGATVDPAAGGAQPVAEPQTPVVGEDNLPDRIVLNVTREELEAAPGYDDVEDAANAGAMPAAPDASGAAAPGAVPAK